MRFGSGPTACWGASRTPTRTSDAKQQEDDLEAIDQAPFNFDPRIGLLLGIMVGFLVFAVALDLTWEQLRRVLKSPKAPVIGLVAKFGILPAVAFGAGATMKWLPKNSERAVIVEVGRRPASVNAHLLLVLLTASRHCSRPRPHSGWRM